jgi:AAA domain
MTHERDFVGEALGTLKPKHPRRINGDVRENISSADDADAFGFDRADEQIGKEKPTRTPLKITYFDEFDQGAAKSWLVKGVLAENETSTIIGPPGSGKSAFVTDISISYAGGKDWRGYRVKESGGVVYFAFERADLTKRRFRAHKQRDHLPDDLPIAVVGQIVDLMDPHCVDLLLQALNEAEQRFGCRIGLAILDTYNKGIAFGGGDEDKAKDQNRALGHLRRLQELYSRLHVCIVAHTGKDETRGARGSNALPGDADIQNQIADGGDVKIVTTVKANDAPEGELMRFRREPFVFGVDEDGDTIQTYIVAPEMIPTSAAPPKAKAKAKRVGRGKRVLRDAIVAMLDSQAETIEIASGQTVEAVTTEKVEADFIKRYVVAERGVTDVERKNSAGDAKRKAFDRALEDPPASSAAARQTVANGFIADEPSPDVPRCATRRRPLSPERRDGRDRTSPIEGGCPCPKMSGPPSREGQRTGQDKCPKCPQMSELPASVRGHPDPIRRVSIDISWPIFSGFADIRHTLHCLIRNIGTRRGKH